MAETRKQRLAEALRENLKRRKVQQRDADDSNPVMDNDDKRQFRKKPLIMPQTYEK